MRSTCREPRLSMLIMTTSCWKASSSGMAQVVLISKLDQILFLLPTQSRNEIPCQPHIWMQDLVSAASFYSTKLSCTKWGGERTRGFMSWLYLFSENLQGYQESNANAT